MNRTEIKKFTLDLFFPNRCPLCGSVIRWDIPYCGECYENLPRTGEEFCRGCGNVSSHCSCGKSKRYFSRCFAAFYYEDTAESAVIWLKTHKDRVFPDIAAEKLCEDIAADGYGVNAEVIVPVPAERMKYISNGFDHAELIARSLADIMGIPVAADAIRKRRSLFSQHTLSAELRKEAVKDLYCAGKTDGVKGKTVILCDDVMTTGATMDECARILIEAGAKDVIAVAAAATKIGRC